MSAAGIVVALLGTAGVVVWIAITRLLYICSPNEVLVFTGGSQSSTLGRRRGYRVIKGGRAMRKPLFEVVDRLDLTNMPIEVAVTSAYSKGGIPLNVHGIANVKIAGEQPVLDNAIERFLGVERVRIMTVAKEVLEGNLRGVLATLTPEELNEDKIKFAQSLLSEAEDDLRALGLELDTLKIQDVSDDVGYLDSIGRRQSAEVQRRALVAEAQAKAESAVQAASNYRDTEMSRLEAQFTTLRADYARRMADVRTRADALIAEAQGDVKAQLARADGQRTLQHARLEQVRRQLQADVLEPARARKAASEAEAKGSAAQIIEQGRASAQAMDEISSAWRQVGSGARNVFLMQKVDELMRIVMSAGSGLKIDRLTILGGVGQTAPGNGGGGGAGDMTTRLIAASEQIRAVTGVDMVAAVRDRLIAKPAPPR